MFWEDIWFLANWWSDQIQICLHLPFHDKMHESILDFPWTSVLISSWTIASRERPWYDWTPTVRFLVPKPLVSAFFWRAIHVLMQCNELFDYVFLFYNRHNDIFLRKWSEFYILVQLILEKIRPKCGDFFLWADFSFSFLHLISEYPIIRYFCERANLLAIKTLRYNTNQLRSA